MKLNPYIAGNPVGGGEAFIGRADVLREVVRVLRNPHQNAIVLYGQRRIGKTSILQHLTAWLPHEGPYHPVLFDLQDKATWPLGRVLQELAQTIAHALDHPNPDLGTDPETAFRDEWLPAILDSLPNSASLVLLLDEFDVLADPKSEQAAVAFFPYLRGLIASDPQRLDFVFVIGRNVADLANIALSLFKSIPHQRVSLLNQEDTVKLVRLAETNHSLRWSDDATERVWQLTNGHPFLTQQLCYLVWEQAYDDEPEDTPLVTPNEVEAVIPNVLEASRNALEWLWNGLPPAERVVASALAEAGLGPISQESLERLLRDSGVVVIIRELQDAPQLLQEWDLIEPADGGYRFRVELLRCWIAERKPLSRVQEELDRIQPLAEGYFQTGKGHYQLGELEEAIPQLRQAIRLNPNHLRANELLADILLTQDQVTEARQLLESLYQYYPAAARPRLVQVLLLQARKAEDEDEQLALYERVLQLEPNQPEAVNSRQQIWIKRGDEDLARNNLDKALRAYQQANLPEYVAKVEALLRHRRLEDAQREMVLLQGAGKYAAALGIAKQLHQDYPEERDNLPDLELLERKTRLDDLYQRAVGALQANDRAVAQKLLAEVVSLEPTYHEATRYLHKAVTGLDVEELQLELEKEKEIRQQTKAQAQDEMNAREKKIKLLQDRLDAEKETRQQVEDALEKETETRSQNQKEIEKLHYQLETESHLRQKVETDTQQEIERRRKLEIEVANLQGQLKAETETRRKAEEIAQQESKRSFQFEAELKQLQDQLKTEIEVRQKAEATIERMTRSAYLSQTKITEVETKLNTERSAWETTAKTSFQKISVLTFLLIVATLVILLSWIPSFLPESTVTPTLVAVHEVAGAVTVFRLGVRSGPGIEFNRLVRLSKNDQLTAVARNEAGDWVFVQVPDGTEGWVPSSVASWKGDLSVLPTRE